MTKKASYTSLKREFKRETEAKMPLAGLEAPHRMTSACREFPAIKDSNQVSKLRMFMAKLLLKFRRRVCRRKYSWAKNTSRE